MVGTAPPITPTFESATLIIRGNRSSQPSLPYHKCKRVQSFLLPRPFSLPVLFALVCVVIVASYPRQVSLPALGNLPNLVIVGGDVLIS